MEQDDDPKGSLLRAVVRWASLLGFTALVTLFLEVVLAFRVDRIEGFSAEQLSTHFDGPGPELRVAWIGDSTSSGVGASSPFNSLPHLVAYEMARSIELSVLSVSGATTTKAIEDQLPKLRDLDPDWVFVAIGNNDVTHLTRRDEFEKSLEHLLHGVVKVKPERVVVLGIAEFGGTPLFARPLRDLAGFRARQLDEVVKRVAQQFDTLYVPIADLTRAGFAADSEGTHAQDKFHPSDAGYRLWADAVLTTLRNVGALRSNGR